MKYGEVFKEGDLIGIVFENKDGKGKLSYFQNGKDLGTAFENINVNENFYFAIQTYKETIELEIFVENWSEKNHKYFNPILKEKILIFLLCMHRRKNEKKTHLPRRLSLHLFGSIKNNFS